MRETRVDLLHLDHATRPQLTPQVDQKSGDLRPATELALDPGERTAAIPERALFTWAALRVALGDELDRAELPVLVVRLHDSDDAALARHDHRRGFGWRLREPTERETIGAWTSSTSTCAVMSTSPS